MTISRTICLGFLTLIAVGTFLLMMPFAASDGNWTHPIVALFTSTSAVCVTGLAVVDTGTYFSGLGQFIVLALFQIGGLGYMTTTTFLILLVRRRFNLRNKLAIQQALDREGIQGSGQLVISIIATAIIFEVIGIFLLLQVFVPDFGETRGLWLAVFHSISAWNNAGFSLFSDSLTGYQSSVLLNLTVSALIIFGGIGQQVIYELYLWLRDRLLKKQVKLTFSLNLKVATSTTVVLLILGTIAFFFIEVQHSEIFNDMDFGDKLLIAWFQSVTTRTAGFNTIDFGAMSVTGLFIAIALMFIGASPGGTGGGLKTTTVRILISCTKSILQGKEEVHLYRRAVPVELILKAIGVVVASVITVIGGTILISLFDPGFDFLQILFEEVSAFATVGLSTGITADLSPWSQFVLILTMYTGRVGVLLLMAALLGDPRPMRIQYPEENLLVG